ncbi:Vitamin K epoxide reductase [Thermoproteus uzoniensis 768-20]|uniref:Vitamin K epoxide reductase n=1 Tax=Thermoproteus uzoniensis (strain 768-20) TaxID=999630 RepID=F2L5N2_THEU7|nr:vitamin K epoxide reductase family protein [Thermoproteus uzoniensis]AEA13578.1 Vitamin K epoxide reductase [Thermoproteus uzoniensis 768-20]
MGRTGWFVLLIAFSVGGLISSALVLYMWYILGRMPPGCYLPQAILPGVTVDCVAVLSSPYAHIGPVPLDGLAAVWFVLNIGLVVAYFRTFKNGVLTSLFYWRLVGIAVLPYLLYIELVVLKALCLYCTIMHIFIIIDFILISIFLKKIYILKK